jgi:hypothetical protein
MEWSPVAFDFFSSTISFALSTHTVCVSVIWQWCSMVHGNFLTWTIEHSSSSRSFVFDCSGKLPKGGQSSKLKETEMNERTPFMKNQIQNLFKWRHLQSENIPR